jgi:FPC/CPF motif-containing protein YcgG
MGGLDPQQSIGLYEAQNPFETPDAFRFSNYSAYVNGQLVRLLDWREPSRRAQLAHNALRAFIGGDSMACVGAKGAVGSGGYRFGFYPALASPSVTQGLARDLASFVAELPYIAARYKSFVAVFDGATQSELDFEQQLWNQLQLLHDADARHFGWDPGASNDPSDPSFGFSVAEHAFFVVGLHANASRGSRRFHYPAIAFNSHRLFAELRETGHFERVREHVREREAAIQGTLNPNLADYGEASEARQYSGRAVEDQWRCPFHPRSS